MVLLDRCEEVSFGPALTAQADGLLNDSWLFLRKGEVALHDADGPPRVLGPGDCFGEGALLGRGRLPTAVALTDAVCWRLRRDDFTGARRADDSLCVQTFRNFPPRPARAWEWLAQRGPADCGVAALAMALRGLGSDVTFEQLAALTPLGPAGASLAALARAAQQAGGRAAAVRVGLEQLADARLPAVAHIGGGHFVTLFEVSHDTVVIGDPAEGIRSVSTSAFRRDWSGHLLLLHPERRGPETAVSGSVGALAPHGGATG
jgi:hypothetical protein